MYIHNELSYFFWNKTMNHMELWRAKLIWSLITHPTTSSIAPTLKVHGAVARGLAPGFYSIW